MHASHHHVYFTASVSFLNLHHVPLASMARRDVRIDDEEKDSTTFMYVLHTQ